MVEIKLYIDVHNNKERLFAKYIYNTTVNKIIRTVTGAAWSHTKKQWHFNLDKQIVKEIQQKTKGVAALDTDMLRQQLINRKKIVSIRSKASSTTKIQTPLTTKTITAFAVTTNNLQQLQLMIKTLQLKAYSNNTITLYRNEVLALMRILAQRPIEQLTPKQIKSYLLWLLQTKKYSEAKVHTAINALKFYFEQVLYQPKMFFEIPRPKKPAYLAGILTGHLPNLYYLRNNMSTAFKYSGERKSFRLPGRCPHRTSPEFILS